MPERDSHQYIARSVAAAQALARLIPERVAEDSRSIESRKLIAVAISALIPVYRRALPSGALRRVTEAETAIGKLVDEYVGVDHSRAA